MFRPAVKSFEEIQTWVNKDSPWIQVDEVLESYANWTDRTSWPHRADGDGVHNEGSSVDPRTKPGLVGAFCRAFSVTDAIEKFELPYKAGSAEGRLTYADGSRPDGAIIYDDDTKLHSHHDTDPARGQSNAYDLVRLHHYGWLDGESASVPLSDRPSSKAMGELSRSFGEVRAQLVVDEGFEDLDATDTEWLDAGVVEAGIQAQAVASELPERIAKATSKFTDQENARRIQRRYGNALLSVGKTFYSWTGTHWEKDDGQALRHITKLSQIVGAEAKKLEESFLEKNKGEKLTEDQLADVAQIWGWAGECGQRSRISNCEMLLRGLLGFDAKALNSDPFLFSCANGTLDLRTAVLRPHDPKDFITACSPVAYDAAAEAPRFLKFLQEIYDEDVEVVGFAQRWFGYCLTGSINEHKLVFHVGRGGNGKGTLMDLLSHVLGSGYYSTTSQKLLTMDEKGATPELAGLLGRRMVTVGETDENLELRDGLVKAITGGDTINARHLFKDPFEFRPTHKLQVFTNHAPVVKSQDFAMWRRILLLNYPISYGDAVEVARGDASRQKDPHLEGALKAEAPGVLRWLVDGAREWFTSRLQPPAAVLNATRQYRDDQDLIGQFARERLLKDASAWTALTGRADSVFPAYRGWCSGMNIRPLGRTRFVREILRVAPYSRNEPRREGSTIVPGFTGFALTGDSLDD